MPLPIHHGTLHQEQKLLEQTESLAEQLIWLTDEEILALETALNEHIKRAMKQRPRMTGEEFVALAGCLTHERLLRTHYGDFD